VIVKMCLFRIFEQELPPGCRKLHILPGSRPVQMIGSQGLSPGM
jgi:hypothetical protein